MEALTFLILVSPPALAFLLLPWLGGDLELVEGPSHLGEGDDELLIRANGDHVPVTVSPGDGEVSLRAQGGEHCSKLALEEGEAGADILVHHEPPHFSVNLCRPLGQEYFVGDSVRHFTLAFC